MIRIQDIQFKPSGGPQKARELYFRVKGGSMDVDTEDVGFLDQGATLDLFTYFGALSVEKWRRFTYAESFSLTLEAEGTFTVELIGGYLSGTQPIKEDISSVRVDLRERREITLNYPKDGSCQLVACRIRAHSVVHLYNMYYGAELEAVADPVTPYISLITTTFRKEEFVRRNEQLLRAELFSDPRYRDGFCWHIIDNGGTLPEEDDGMIRVHHNRNVGGAGGFARGMLETLRQKRKASHVLLMDDDIRLSVTSLKRLYVFLSLLRPAYRDDFVGGAMLKLEQPFIQHENTAILKTNGRCSSLGQGLDLRKADCLILNEGLPTYAEGRHAAWWFCCIPMTIVREDNLPLPVFFRGDDIEYSVRNHARIITLNGIGVWHQSFERRYNQTVDYYQSRRNELIITAMLPQLSQVDTFGFTEELFWQELYKFNYAAAELLCDAVEDYLKGPEWFAGTDLGAVLKEKSRKDLDWKPIEEPLKWRIIPKKLFVYKRLKGIRKFIYDYTYNGQARIPECLLRKSKEGIIPAGMYFQKRMCLTARNYMVDYHGDRYALLIKDRKQFRRTKRRFVKIKNCYLRERDAMNARYRDAARGMTNAAFWDRYLSGADH